MDERKPSSFDLAKSLKGFWPIRWKELFQFKLVITALYSAPRVLRYSAAVLAVMFGVSLVLASTNLYTAITVVVGAEGGVFREAAVGGDMDVFNPLVDRTDPEIGRENNIPEKKINSLLYLPLYTIDYPNFLRDPQSQPKIKPILLESAPQWQEKEGQPKFTRLAMKLRSDMQWSDGSPITLADIQYSFARLKEPKGSPEFRGIFAAVTMEVIDTNSFVLVATESSPNLLYTANFSPISSKYFEDKNTEGLLIDRRSIRPQVTSGHFIIPEQIDNPETTRKDEQQNPIVLNNKNTAVVLKNVPNPNIRKIFGKTTKIEYFVMKRFDRIAEGGTNQLVLSQAAAEKTVDFFERNYESDTLLSPSRVAQLVNLTQRQVPTNTFLTLFYNIKRGSTGYLVNQSLRKYITCNLLQYSNNFYRDYLIEIPKERRILPIAFGEFTTIDCGTDYAKNLDSNYEISISPATKQKQVLIKASGQVVALEVIGFPENRALLNDLAVFFSSEIGIPLNVITQEKEFEKRLTDRNYNMALLPYSLTSRDISEFYSAKKRDLVSIPGNDRVAQYNFNENLDKYTQSNGEDRIARQALIDFFSRELVSLNLYQYQYEYNYSPLIKELENSLPAISAGPIQVEMQVNRWYINTVRVLR